MSLTWRSLQRLKNTLQSDRDVSGVTTCLLHSKYFLLSGKRCTLYIEHYYFPTEYICLVCPEDVYRCTGTLVQFSLRTHHILFPGSPQACCSFSCGPTWQIVASSLFGVKMTSLVPRLLLRLKAPQHMIVDSDSVSGGGINCALLGAETPLHILHHHAASKIFIMCRTHTLISHPR